MIESAYRVDLPLDAWFDDVVSAMSRALDGEARGVGMLFDATRPDWVELSKLRTQGFPEWVKPALETPVDMPIDVRMAAVRVFRRGAFGRLFDFLDQYGPPLSALLRGCGIEQLSGLIAPDPTLRSCLFGVATRDKQYSRRTHYLWTKVGAHLSAGLRLRRVLDSMREENSNVVEHAEAVLSTNGKVEHAAGPATAAAARSALQEALVRIDAARSEAEEESVDLWSGLVAGRWSLVEHHEHDGRRYFLAYRNDPDLTKVRALTARELQVCSYAALGYTNKLIGYTLGLATPTVARYLERARRKLGGRAALEALQTLQPARSEEPRAEQDPAFEH